MHHSQVGSALGGQMPNAARRAAGVGSLISVATGALVLLLFWFGLAHDRLLDVFTRDGQVHFFSFQPSSSAVLGHLVPTEPVGYTCQTGVPYFLPPPATCHPPTHPSFPITGAI